MTIEHESHHISSASRMIGQYDVRTCDIALIYVQDVEVPYSAGGRLTLRELFVVCMYVLVRACVIQPNNRISVMVYFCHFLPCGS